METFVVEQTLIKQSDVGAPQGVLSFKQEGSVVWRCMARNDESDPKSVREAHSEGYVSPVVSTVRYKY